jgi:hypothetical protein
MSNRRQILRSGAALVAAAAAAPRLGVLAQSATPGATTGRDAGVPVDIATLPLKTPGQLTVHADQPAYPPFFIDDDPSNGQGFESALTYAVAERLGFSRDQLSGGTPRSTPRTRRGRRISTSTSPRSASPRSGGGRSTSAIRTTHRRWWW